MVGLGLLESLVYCGRARNSGLNGSTALRAQTRFVLRAAWKLDSKADKARIEQFGCWVETQHLDTAGSLREELDELFTVSTIGLTPALKRCLGTTKVIDTTHSGMRRRTGHMMPWKNGSAVVRWVAAAFLKAEKGYRRIMGYRDCLDAQSPRGRALHSPD